ncbi:TPA: AraC family transcriptional regulator [Legionella bozemanae]|uniref:AraC family transcriptional regulator n=1 Tax=Legionella bozemanae TaxID=447 RepID=UPI00216B3402|nr:AraC family transcriptional regulator [Legionella bozemanae]
MNYKYQLEKVIEFIGKHLDEKLDLTQLSTIACFSKYHFHRLFTAYTGLSLQQYIRCY